MTTLTYLEKLKKMNDYFISKLPEAKDYYIILFLNSEVKQQKEGLRNYPEIDPYIKKAVTLFFDLILSQTDNESKTNLMAMNNNLKLNDTYFVRCKEQILELMRWFRKTVITLIFIESEGKEND